VVSPYMYVIFFMTFSLYPKFSRRPRCRPTSAAEVFGDSPVNLSSEDYQPICDSLKGSFTDRYNPVADPPRSPNSRSASRQMLSCGGRYDLLLKTCRQTRVATKKRRRLVYERSGRWFRIELMRGSAWIEPTIRRIRLLSDSLASDSFLTYLRPGWTASLE